MNKASWKCILAHLCCPVGTRPLLPAPASRKEAGLALKRVGSAAFMGGRVMLDQSFKHLKVSLGETLNPDGVTPDG